MAKYSRVYVVLATEGIDDAAVLVSCHCVYCQIASAEIFLETDIRRDIERAPERTLLRCVDEGRQENPYLLADNQGSEVPPHYYLPRPSHVR